MMENIPGDPMGRVNVRARLEYVEDALRAARGELPSDEVRTVVVEDALIDTGCTTVGLPSSLIQQLGLTPVTEKQVVGAIGKARTTVYGTVRLSIMDRSCSTDVFEVPDDVPVLIGQVPLEQLDFVVDPGRQELTGNPRHGGEHILEAY